MWEEVIRLTCLQNRLQTYPLTHKKSYTKFQNPITIFAPLIHPKIAHCRRTRGSTIFGLSGVRALPVGVATERSFYYFGPSGVRALPVGLAAKQSVHYFCDYFSFFLRHILFSQKGLCFGSETLHGLLCPPIYQGFHEKKISGPDPPKKADFGGTKVKNHRSDYRRSTNFSMGY